jgi:predicted AlkP superfamily phosphohydrolase/phosphomutase
MLWTSIATGKMAYHHGVEGFTEVDPVSGGIVPVSAATRKCKTAWEMLGEHGLRSHVVSWFATQGERDLDGWMISTMWPFEGHPGGRRSRGLARTDARHLLAGGSGGNDEPPARQPA